MIGLDRFLRDVLPQPARPVGVVLETAGDRRVVLGEHRLHIPGHFRDPADRDDIAQKGIGDVLAIHLPQALRIVDLTFGNRAAQNVRPHLDASQQAAQVSIQHFRLRRGPDQTGGAGVRQSKLFQREIKKREK